MSGVRRSKRFYRMWPIIPALAILVVVCWRVKWSDVLVTLTAMKSMVASGGILSADGLRLFGAVFVIAAGLIALKLRKRQSQPVRESAAPPADSGVWSGLTIALTEYLVRRWRPAGTAILALFLLVNAAFGVSYVRNAIFAQSSPNIIYIMVDTLRADHLGCYGYSRNTSPNIDRFAAGAIRFSKAISQAPWTTPSITSFMTSRYVPMSMDHLQWAPMWMPLMPEILKDKGYVTSAVVSNQIAGSSVYLNRGYDWFSEYFGAGNRGVTSPEVTRRALHRIRDTKGQRFFMFAHFMDPHDPYVLHPGHDFYPDYKGRLRRDRMLATACSGDDLKHEEALYDSEIAFTDEYIGKIFDELKRQGLYDDSLIVLLADHGEEFCDHGGIKHSLTLYDELLSVPLIIKLPGQHQGRVVAGNFPLIDLLPSVLKCIHIDTSALKFQGADVPLNTVSVLRDKEIYSRTNGGPVNLSSLRSAKWKVIKDGTKRTYRLFDLVNDPKEQHNLASARPDLALALGNQVTRMDKQVIDAMGDLKALQAPPEQERGFQKNLRSLGYLQ
jgi:arylsulfatase A-like enzyme